MERNAYNANTIFKIKLGDWEERPNYVYTDRVESRTILFNQKCVRKLEEGMAFYYINRAVPVSTWDVDFVAATKEELEAKNPHLVVKIGVKGKPVVYRKPYVEVEFLNGKYHTEWFDNMVEAEDYFNHITDMANMKGIVPFEFLKDLLLSLNLIFFPQFFSSY